MEKELERLMNDLSPSEADEFISSFESFGGSYVSPDEQDRILSSVMRKAGFEMKETTKKTRIKHSKRLIGFIIAAAVALTGAIGAFAYNRFINRESVEYYLDDVEALEEKGYAANLVTENEHLRLTVDAVLSDGVNAYILETKEALDDIGYDYLHGNNYFTLYGFRYADTGEYIDLQDGFMGYFDLDRYDIGRSCTVYNISQIDIDREVDMIFFALDTTKPTGELDEHNIPVDNTFDYDTVVTVVTLDFSKNCEIKTLTSSDGSQIRLSQFEIICDDADVTYTYGDSLHLIKKNGKYEELDVGKLYAYIGTDRPDCIILGKFIDLDKYSGVEIGGVEYLDINK